MTDPVALVAAATGPAPILPAPVAAPSPQARFDADGLPRGLMPISGIRCGEWL